MTNEEFRAAIDAVKVNISETCCGKSIALIVPACMEMVLMSITSIEDKDDALRLTESLRPMIDYIESRVRGMQ